MASIKEILTALPGMDQKSVEEYVAHEWIKPTGDAKNWQFDEVDMARIRLVHHLKSVLLVDDNALDIVLHLLDQLYTVRTHLQRFHYALEQQPAEIQQSFALILEAIVQEK